MDRFVGIRMKSKCCIPRLPTISHYCLFEKWLLPQIYYLKKTKKHRFEKDF